MARTGSLAAVIVGALAFISVIVASRAVRVPHASVSSSRGAVHDFESVIYRLSHFSPYFSPAQQNASGWPTPQPPPPAHCRPLALELVARHGSRQPLRSMIVNDFVWLQDEIAQHTEAFSQSPVQYQWMKSWVSPYPLTDDGQLLPQGGQEHYDLAKRTQTIEAPLLSSDYSTMDYSISSTQVPRTAMSASSFAMGFLEDDGTVGPRYQPVFINMTNLASDTELRFFDRCPSYEAATAPTAKAEGDAYYAVWGPIVAANITYRLFGAQPGWQLTPRHVFAMWLACAFEVTYNSSDTAHFCGVFDGDALDVMEAYQDLLKYSIFGYANEVNPLIASPLVQAMVREMDAIIAHPEKPLPRTYLRFAHYETIAPLVVALGLFRDATPLSAQHMPRDRLWRSSQFGTFAGNTQLVLYNCTGAEGFSSDPSDESSYGIKLVQSEAAQLHPACGGQVVCNYAKFKAAIAPQLSLNFESFCNPPPPSPPAAVYGLSIGASAGALGAIIAAIFIALAVLLVRSRLNPPRTSYQTLID